MTDIADLAMAAWRLEKWLQSTEVERKMAAKSALRTINAYLAENGIEMMDLTGCRFDAGYAVEVIESTANEDDTAVISEMIRPIITKDGSVVKYGQVVLA